MALRWLTAALADLRGISAYIAEGNPGAAKRVIAHIHSETEILPGGRRRGARLSAPRPDHGMGHCRRTCDRERSGRHRVRQCRAGAALQQGGSAQPGIFRAAL